MYAAPCWTIEHMLWFTVSDHGGHVNGQTCPESGGVQIVRPHFLHMLDIVTRWTAIMSGSVQRISWTSSNSNNHKYENYIIENGKSVLICFGKWLLVGSYLLDFMLRKLKLLCTMEWEMRLRIPKSGIWIEREQLYALYTTKWNWILTYNLIIDMFYIFWNSIWLIINETLLDTLFAKKKQNTKIRNLEIIIAFRSSYF